MGRNTAPGNCQRTNALLALHMDTVNKGREAVSWPLPPCKSCYQHLSTACVWRSGRGTMGKSRAKMAGRMPQCRSFVLLVAHGFNSQGQRKYFTLTIGVLCGGYVLPAKPKGSEHILLRPNGNGNSLSFPSFTFSLQI